MAVRSDKNQSSWALMGLAVRIARGLGLHRDGEGRAFSAFEAEMRRRLWWQILVLDIRASADRGTEPVILEGSFNTAMPCNLNDEDFTYASQHPLKDKKGFTEMTFCLLSMDVSNTNRKINYIPHTGDCQPLTLEQKKELVKQCTDRIESHYLAGCDPSDQSTWLACTMGRLLIFRLWLLIQYPLESRKSAPQEYPRAQSLRTAVAFLTILELLEESESSAGFTWFFKTYVPWHPLAVALAELCTETQGPLADQAWCIIDKGYEKWSDRVDDKGGMLWRPIKSLLSKARAARHRDQEASEAAASSRPSVPDPNLQDYSIDPRLPSLGVDADRSQQINPLAFEDLSLISQNTDPPLEMNFFGPMDALPMGTAPLSGPINWDDWNEFVFDVGAPQLPQNPFGEWPMQI